MRTVKKVECGTNRYSHVLVQAEFICYIFTKVFVCYLPNQMEIFRLTYIQVRTIKKNLLFKLQLLVYLNFW